MPYSFGYKIIFCIFGSLMITDLFIIITKNYITNRKLTLSDDSRDELYWCANRFLFSVSMGLSLYNKIQSE